MKSTNQIGQDIRKTAEDVKDTASEVYQEEKNKAAQAFEDAKDSAKVLNQKMSEAAADLYEQGKAHFNKAEESVLECSDEVIKTIKEKPISSLLIAAGIGFILSRLFKK